MNGLQSSLYTVAFALCLFSTGILRDKKIRTGHPFTFFTSFLVIEALGYVFELLMASPTMPFKALWLGLRMATSLFIAPCLWLAIRESAEDTRPRISSLSRGHVAAIGAGIVLLFPLIQTTHSGLDYPDPNHVVSAWHSRAIHATMLLCIAIFAVQVPFYLGRCQRILMAQRAADSPGGRGARQSLAWMQLPLVLVAATWVIGILRTLHCMTHSPAPRTFGMLFATADVTVTVGSLYVMVGRAWVPEREEAAAAPSKYARSQLDPQVRTRIKRKLEAALADEELYRDGLLNLRSLSHQIRERAHYVSQVINQDLRCTFYEYLNHHRIERAKAQLAGSPSQTVLEVALSVGFNSKSTFNAAFLRYTGMTPRQFRADRQG